MKKLLLFVSAIALGFTSCSKDDDSSTSAALEGKWEYFKDGTTFNGQEVLTDYNHTEGCSKDYVMITSTTVTDHEFFGADCTEGTYSTTYTRNGNTLTVTEGDQNYTSTIMQLDGSTLKIKSSYTFEGQTTDDITVYKRVN